MTFHSLPVEDALRFLAGKDRFALFESVCGDRENNLSYLFFEPIGTLEVKKASELPVFFDRLEDYLKNGNYVVGFFSYETGYGLEEAFRSTGESFPFSLARFHVYARPEVFEHRSGLFENGFTPKGKEIDRSFSIDNIFLDVMPEEYKRNINRIKELIADGETYQVNYTLKCQFSFSGSPLGLYLHLRRKQSVPYAVFFRDSGLSLLSFSPELFFRKKGDAIMVRPMKGTISRGENIFRDRRNAKLLRQNPKDRAENLMIVDLLRNDLGKVSETGTVKVDSLFDIERYETLFQMTSTISARLKKDLGLFELFKAIFPSGSVTGAPKIRTMELIRQMERGARKVYTGGVGMFFPNRDAVFNVAIRTILLAGSSGEMGIGSGIVFDSTPEKEYAECKLKARFLTGSLM